MAVFPIFGVLGHWFQLTDRHATWILVPVALLAAQRWSPVACGC